MTATQRSPEEAEAVVDGQRLPVIWFDGELDVASAFDLKRAALEQLPSVPDGGLVVDLSGLTFTDSRGVSTLLTIRKLLGGRPMYLRGLSPRPLDSFRMMGIDRLFTFLPKADDPDPPD